MYRLSELLHSGKAHAKMREIIRAQGGNQNIESIDLKPGEYKKHISAQKKGSIASIDNCQISTVCRILGCPTDKRAGLYIHRRIEDAVDRNDILYTIYSSDRWRLEEAVETVNHIPIYAIR